MTSSSSSSTIGINHPYFFSSADHPRLSLVAESLNDQNYHHQNQFVKIALSIKLKLDFIDGSLFKPTDSSSQISLWMRSNDMVISWTLKSVSTDIRKSVVYMNTAKQICDDLALRYSQSNVPRLFHLRKELSSFTQGTKYVTAYFTEFCNLIDELDNLSPIPKCSCINSTCTFANQQKLKKYENMLKLSQFLMGLSVQFTPIQGQILLVSHLPDIDSAYAMLL